MVVICVVALIFPHTSIVLAAALTNETPNNINSVNLTSVKYREGGEESSDSLSDEGEEKYDRKSYEYIFSKDGKSTTIQKIIREDDKNEDDEYLFSDAFYCLDGTKSFPTINGFIKYNRTVEDFLKDNPTTLGLNANDYNSLCWLINSMYLAKQMTASQRKEQKDALIKNAFKGVLENNEVEDETTVDDIKAIITDDDIEVIQQWAIWYFTNNGANTTQGVPFTNTNNTLPNIDLRKLQITSEGNEEQADSMDPKRKAWLEILYQYFVKEAKNNANKEFENSSIVYPEIQNKNLAKFDTEGENYKIGPFKISAPSNNLTSNDYTIKLTDEANNEISNYTVKDSEGNVINKKVNQIFDTDYYIYIPNTVNVENVKLELTYTELKTKASVWQAERSDYQPLILITKEGVQKNDSVTVNIKLKADFALRKYITAVNGKAVASREPQIDSSKLVNGETTTAEYKHRKDAVQVKKGDLVTYKISVYNEGNVPGKVTGIIDYLPEGLQFVKENETNIDNGWNISDDGRVATTSISKDSEINAFDKANNKIVKLDVEIVCEVTNDIAGTVLTNIAEILSDNIEDIDSSTGNVNINSIDTQTYKGKTNETDLSKSDIYYEGMEDDDDFEKVVIAGKAFDLSLQKFITKVNGKDVETREPKVDTTPLKNNSTDAKYTQVKTPVLVKKGDIVTYKIRVYNEGEVNGYAEDIADYLPTGLGYLVNYNKNIENYWAIPEDSKTVKLNTITNGTKNLKKEDFTGITDLDNVDVVTGKVKLNSTALSSKSEANLLKAFDGSDKLDYKDIEVVCIVLDDSNLKNIAEIKSHSDENKNPIVDRDSIPDTVNPDDYPGKDENQDDNDYEILTIKTFDLALQKFITAVNSKEINDRVPKISYENGKIKYSHPQNAVEVNSGDNVTYTIRVYNEGEIDGYAAEIGDDIPKGLVFDPTNETNIKYGWKMIDSTGNETKDLNKAVEIRTDYLSKEKSEIRKEDSLMKAFDSQKGELSYFDVKAIFKVNAASADETIINTAEITKDTDSDGNEIEDIDSIPDNKKDGEDDIDKERVHVGYFDLALKKDLQKAVIIEGDSTKEIQAVNGQLMKVEINRKKINSTIVKFVYDITITNEGTIPGYAKEIRDYIPEGLQFVETDNTNWTGKAEGTITSTELENKLLQPGESAKVSVVLRWINDENNLGMKTNIAEISKDYNESNDSDDIDSTPDNKKDGEDDIDSADVILSIATGRAPIYILLTTGILMIITTGIVAIKKYVL